MSRIFGAIGRLSVRFRWLVVAAWLTGTAAAVISLPSLSSVTQNNNAGFLPANAPSNLAAALAAPLVNPNSTTISVVIARSAGSITPSDQAAIARLRQQLAAVPGVRSVTDAGLSSDNQAEQLQVNSPIAPNNQPQVTSLVQQLRATMAGAGLPADMRAHLAGGVADNVDSNARGGSASSQIQTYSMIFIIVLLLFIFRSLLAPLITLAPAAVVVTLAEPVIAEATHAGLKVSQLAQFMLIVIVLGAGTDYGLFLIFRVREEIRRGLPHREAVSQAVARVGESITFSAGTVIAALLSLLAATFGVYSNLGVPLAIGIALMLLAGLTLMPALMAIFGRALFWPVKVVPTATPKTEAWGRLAGRIVRRPAVTLAAGLAVFLGMAAAVLGLHPAGFGGASTAPAGSDSAAGDALVARHFPSAAAIPTLLVFHLAQPAWASPGGLSLAQRQLQGDALFTAVAGPLTPNGRQLSPAEFTTLHGQLGSPARLPAAEPAGLSVQAATYQAYRSTAQYVSADGKTVLISVKLAAGNPTSTAAMQAVPAIRAAAASAGQVMHATASGVVGAVAVTYDVASISTSDLKTVIPIAIAVIAVLLALVLRSLVAPLYLVFSVGLSYLAALGLSVLIFTTTGTEQGVSFVLPFLLFLFLMGLGSDYNILVMTRIREEAHQRTLRTAVVTAVQATGTTITSAGLVLAGTFAVFAIVGAGTSNGTQLRDVGTGLALGILMDTFGVRSLLVPSAVVLLGRWNWWPSRLAGRRARAATQLTEPNFTS
jgi:putative drug exporter of the RND superfamily